MRFTADVMIVGSGVHGPFKDDKGTDREGRTIPYVTVSPSDGQGDPMQATLAEGVDGDALPRFKAVTLSFELRRSYGDLKLRTYGLAQSARAAAA